MRCSLPLIKHSLRQIQVHDHICFVYQEQEEQHQTIGPFIQIGLERLEKCIYIADENSPDKINKVIQANIDHHDSFLASGALEVVTKQDCYLKDGCFDPERMIAFLEERVHQAKADGFSALRVMGEMSWALGTEPGTERLIEYEAKLNSVFSQLDILAICQYNQRKFPAHILLAIIKTHPLLFLNNELCQNYYYIPPDEFLGSWNAEQEVERYLNIVYDQKIHTQSIKQKDFQYQELFTRMAQGVVYHDADGNIVSANPAALEILGVKKEEMTNRTSYSPEWKSIREDGSPFPGEEHPSMVALRTGKQIKDVIMGVFNPKEQRYRWIHVNAVPEFLPGYDAPYRVFTTFSDITKRIETEKSLRDSESRFSKAFHNSPLLMTISSVQDGRYIEVNEAFTRVTGYSRETAFGATSTELGFISRENRSRLLDILNREGQIREIELELTHANGTPIFCLYSGELIEIEGETFLLSVASDITQRKQTEATLRESEQKWRNILVSTPQIGIAIDPRENITFANTHFLKLTGWREDEILGQNWFDLFIPEELREEIRGVFQKVMVSQDAASFSYYENEILTRSGERRNVAWSNLITKNANGSVLDVICLGIDLTERNKAEQDLLSQQRMITLNNRIANVFLTSPTHEIYAEVLNVILKTLNSQYGYFGYIDEEGNLVCPSMTRDIWNKCQVEDKSIVFPQDIWGGLWGQSLKEKSVLIANEGLQFPEGHVQLENAMAVPILYYEDLIGQFVVANKPGGYNENDRELLESVASQTAPILKARLDEEKYKRERASLEEQLQQSQKMEAIGTLAGGVAHDFNNILMAILGNSQMVLDKIQKEDPIFEEMQQIYQAGERATSLTNQLLAFSRKQVIQPKILHLGDKVNELEKMLQRIMGEDIELHISCEDSLGTIKADPGQIDQIVMNLAVNARDAMPKGGSFHIDMQNIHLDQSVCDYHLGLEPGAFVMMTVSDSGCGMPREIQNKIFEPFFTTKDKGQGTGLGLSTVYGIVKQSGASITVYSELDRGTTLKIYFPRIEQAPVTKTDADAHDVDFTGKETILVVEDEETVRFYVKRVLTKNGYRVLTASQFQEALNRYNQSETPVDLLLTDVVLPQKSGKVIAEQLAEINPSIQIIFMSGYTDDAILKYDISFREVNFIQKPFTPKVLLRKVREVLDNKT